MTNSNFNAEEGAKPSPELRQPREKSSVNQTGPTTQTTQKIETGPTGPKGHAALRYGATLPVAAVMTLGLMLTMAGLVATEFAPQDKTETTVYEINPKVDDITVAVRTLELDPLREVETPPAPPVLETLQTAEVTLPIVAVPGKKTVFDKSVIDMGAMVTSVHIDKEPIPLRRVPPVLPHRFAQGDVSGYCRVQFDINPQGQPLNVSIMRCTDKRLQSATVKSVQQWKYAPQMQGGRAVTRTGLQTTIQFELRDERGRLLPLPAGY